MPLPTRRCPGIWNEENKGFDYEVLHLDALHAATIIERERASQHHISC